MKEERNREIKGDTERTEERKKGVGESDRR